tara:strand:+ start:905 stop:1291 length:387 start_codon:yes stop_codon:yes gene_type:complete
MSDKASRKNRILISFTDAEKSALKEMCPPGKPFATFLREQCLNTPVENFDSTLEEFKKISEKIEKIHLDAELHSDVYEIKKKINKMGLEQIDFSKKFREDHAKEREILLRGIGEMLSEFFDEITKTKK